MGTRALVIGESLTDLVQRPDGSTEEHVGGSPANVAIGLARLGHEVTFATQLGADERGATIASHLEGEGVSLAEGSVSRIGSATSVATSTLDASGQAAYSFDLAWELPREHPPEGLTHVHTGSIAATLEPGASAVLATIEGARPGATISYDLNVRPSLMGEPHETRHLMVANEQAVISPPWSIHSGCGTASYTFIWAMGGENIDYRDLSAVPMGDLK